MILILTVSDVCPTYDFWWIRLLKMYFEKQSISIIRRPLILKDLKLSQILQTSLAMKVEFVWIRSFRPYCCNVISFDTWFCLGSMTKAMKTLGAENLRVTSCNMQEASSAADVLT